MRTREELEEMYVKGTYYDGLGVYIGVIDTYPWNEDHFIRDFHFSEISKESNVPGKINKIFIAKIKKEES